MSQAKEERVFYDILDGRDELERLYDRDKERFIRAHFPDLQNASQAQLASRLIFSSHSLEKSLSNDGFEIGHGFMVVGMLVDFLNTYEHKKYDKTHLAYKNTISVLSAFYERHKGTEREQELESILGDWLAIVDINKIEIGGSDKILIKEKDNNEKKNFRELAEGRFAVRSYSNKHVNKKDIEDAIQIATKTPTVCNRQPVRVRVMYNKDVIERVLEVQGGIAHYDTPPALLLITADDNNYIGINERNQGYIDGGLFAMSVLYALEYKKLAACPLHAMFETERDFNIRGLLNIPNNEKLITFISVGHFRETSNVCRSFRYPAEFLITESDQIHNFRTEQVTQPLQSIVVEIGLTSKIRIKLRLRTRIRNMLRYIKHTTRIRTRGRKFTVSLVRYIERRRHANADGAILTLTGYFNYGNIMQRYSLQKFLKDNGFNFVSYVDPYSAPRDIYRISIMTKIKTPLRAVKRFLKYQKPYWYTPKFNETYPEAPGWQNIIEFVNKNIWIKQYDPLDDYENYIVGSDQVWRDWWNDREKLGYYFLNFLKGRKTNRVSYAASLGMDTIEDVMNPKDVEYIRPYIEEFDSISVREKTGANIIKKTWGIGDTKEVVDPTLLLDLEDYSSLIDGSDVKYEKIQPIFTYILNETSETRDFVRKIQDERQQAVTGICAHGGSEGDILPPVELWLKGFRDAELVMTNSFHGMMFSIINNTNFIIIGKEDGGLSRIKDFLSEYDIDGRFVDQMGLADFDIDKLKPINWTKVNGKLKKRREQSSSWLLNSINRNS